MVERHNGEDDNVAESWLDRAIVSFDVVPSSEEDDADAAIASFMAITGSSDENTGALRRDGSTQNCRGSIKNKPRTPPSSPTASNAERGGAAPVSFWSSIGFYSLCSSSMLLVCV